MPGRFRPPAGGASSSDSRSRVGQEEVDRATAAHHRFLERDPGGARAIFRLRELRGLTLAGRRLAEADFTGADLQECDLSAAELRGAILYCADLRRADLEGARLNRADLRGATLRGANLRGAQLDGADLRTARLTPEDGDLFRLFRTGDDGRAIERQVDFRDCSLRGAQLGKVRLAGADFSGANLHGVDVRGARLDGATFEGAILTGVRVADLRASPEQLAGCLFDPTPAAMARADALRTMLAGSAIWVETGGAQGAAAAMDGEDLRPLGPALVKARLTAASLRKACGVGLSFSGCELQGARFDGADLRGANFAGADLRGASFADANLCHARFDFADLGPLWLDGGEPKRVDFTGARMTGVILPAATRAG